MIITATHRNARDTPSIKSSANPVLGNSLAGTGVHLPGVEVLIDVDVGVMVNTGVPGGGNVPGVDGGGYVGVSLGNVGVEVCDELGDTLGVGFFSVAVGVNVGFS